MIKNNQIFSLDDSNFDNGVQSKDGKLVLVDFWAEWCNPCKMFVPVLEEIAIEYQDRVRFGKLNVDGNPLMVKKYNIRSIPTLLLFHGGVVIDTKVGALSKKQVQEILDANLKNQKI